MPYNARKLALLYKQKPKWDYEDMTKLIEYSGINESQALYIIAILTNDEYKITLSTFLDRTFHFSQFESRKYKNFDENKFLYFTMIEKNIEMAYLYAGIPKFFLRYVFDVGNDKDLILSTREKYDKITTQCLLPRFIVEDLIDKYQHNNNLDDEEIYFMCILLGHDWMFTKVTLWHFKTLKYNNASSVNKVTTYLFDAKNNAIMENYVKLTNIIFHPF
jgi:hypothetical protein